MTTSQHPESKKPFRRFKDGVTLIELTVVIIVVFAFISLLFIGARAWKRGADRTQCVMNIRNVQQAVRGYSNAHDLEEGDFLTLLGSNGPPGAAIIGSGNYLENMPECPGLGLYTIHGNTVPATGRLYMTCSLAGPENHEPEMYGTW